MQTPYAMKNMPEGGWVASDATKYSLKDQRPNWVSLVSVAIAVDDIVVFDQEYVDIVERKIDEYGINTQHPIIKNQDINRWGTDWERKNIREDIVVDLLSISAIKNIQIVETSLHSRWVKVFQSDENKSDRIPSEEFIENYLQPYYNLISIWEYLRKSDRRPSTYRNVLTDDFSGKSSPAWIQIGEMSEDLRVIPKGDQIYPLLSLADLVMELVKQEVDEWNEDHIYRYLKRVTPDDSAYIDSDAVNDDEILEIIAPHTTHNINTALHYPSPVLYIESGDVNSNTLTSLDFFDHAAKFARENGGCVKFFHENQDRDYLTEDDYLIHLSNTKGKYRYLEELNDKRTPKILTCEEAKDLFSDAFGAYG